MQSNRFKERGVTVFPEPTGSAPRRPTPAQPKHGSKHRVRPLRIAEALCRAAAGLAFAGIIVPVGAQQPGVIRSGDMKISAVGPEALPDAPGLEANAGDPQQDKRSQPERATGAIAGTILDTNRDVIQGAHVVLTGRGGDQHEMQSGANGEFTFSALPPGSYKLTVSGAGMETYSSQWIAMREGETRIATDVVLSVASATDSVTVSGNREEIAEEQIHIAEEQRILGVLPNFYSVYDWNAPPLMAKQKFKLAFRSMIDPVAFAGAGGLAGFEQFYNIFPGYGGGIQGYTKRYGAAYANDFSARMLSSAVFASLFRQDPRYFYKGTGSIRSRTMYAMSAAVMTRNDDGHWRPNYSHVLGTFAAGALSNLYYPKASRGLSLTLVNGVVETAGNAGTNLLREFLLKGITAHAGGRP